MTVISEVLLRQSKEAAQASADEKGEVGKDAMRGRDLLTLLTRANMATDVPQNQRLSNAEVLARRLYSPLINAALISVPSSEIPTFLAAGHDTTRSI